MLNEVTVRCLVQHKSLGVRILGSFDKKVKYPIVPRVDDTLMFNEEEYPVEQVCFYEDGAVKVYITHDIHQEQFNSISEEYLKHGWNKPK